MPGCSAVTSAPSPPSVQPWANLHSLSPLAVLGRGYAVCWDDTRTRMIRRATDVNAGDAVRVTLGEGELACEVTRLEPDSQS